MQNGNEVAQRTGAGGCRGRLRAGGARQTRTKMAEHQQMMSCAREAQRKRFTHQAVQLLAPAALYLPDALQGTNSMDGKPA